MVLVVSLDLAGGDVDRDRGRGVEVVPGMSVSHERIRVCGAPVRQARLGIIVAGDPDSSPARLPLLSLGPRLASRFARRRDRVDPPHLLAVFDVVRRDEAADAAIGTGRADHDLAFGDERRERHVVPALVLRDLRRPDFLSSAGVERDEHGVAGGEEDFVPVQRDATARLMNDESVLGHPVPIAPEDLSRLRVERERRRRRTRPRGCTRAFSPVACDVPSSLQATSNPTRSVKPAATTNVPSETVSGKAGRLRGAGPSVTRAPSLGSNVDEWQVQTSSWSALHSATSHPECVQTGLYPPMPSARAARAWAA